MFFGVSQLGRNSRYLVEARETASILQYTGCPLPPQGKELSSTNSNCVELRKLWFCCRSVIKFCQLLVTPRTAARQAPLSSTISQGLLKFLSIELVMLSNHLIFCCPLLLLPSIFLASDSFPMSQLFTSGGQSIGALASESVLPMNIQSWFPLGLTDLISLLFSRVFSSTTVWKYQFFSTQPSLWSNSYICIWLLEKP